MLGNVKEQGVRQRSRGYRDEGKPENEKKRDGVLWTRIVCVKVFGPSAVRRDRWFSGIRWQVSLTWGLCWYEGLISHSGLAYEKYETPSVSPPPSPTPSVYYKIITTRSRPGDCWKTQQHMQRRQSRQKPTNISQYPLLLGKKCTYISRSTSSK